jgi:class 3 adenylate cyclase/tetratricopeptide (TPR) repeat protein
VQTRLVRLRQEPGVPEFPSGTVTFLFTDIEGSTKRWERHPEEMAVAVARHDALLREAIATHRGHVFKTIGDAFCAVFPTAEDAAAAALTAQRALAAEPWDPAIRPIRARMAINTGQAEERDADYFGPPVNRVARLMSAGHGGQTLVSAVTSDHVQERLPEGARLRSLGKHRLKDLSRPERVFQLLATGLPGDFPRLKTSPSPMVGMVAALITTLLGLVSFRVGTRTSSEAMGPELLSPLSLYTGLKALILELSTLNEYVLLAVGGSFLLVAIAIALARWRAVRRERERRGEEPGRISGWVINQRSVAFLGVLALTVLGAYAYQQYLWRVALPIPDDALGIALTREAAAATLQEELADSLYTQGQAEQIIVRQLPVAFDARDTAKARAMGARIGARAVIIYRVDETGTDGEQEYVAYVVFTEPSVGLVIGGTPESQSTGTATPGQQPVQFKEGVPVPVLRTDTLEELVNAAAGIIAYDNNQARKAIQHLELAVPKDAGAPNTGIVNFYLGNAYNLDAQAGLAARAYERATTYYEQRQQAGDILGPQDQLIMVKAALERGRVASFVGNWTTALEWYERALPPRADILARADGLERPSDVQATYARLYTLMADAYRFQGRAEDQRSWENRAQDEVETLAAMAGPDDHYPRIQESSARFFMGDCTGAHTTLEEALQIDPGNAQALINAGIVALSQGRPDVAREYWQRIIDQEPNDVAARQLIAESLVLNGLEDSFFEPAYLLEAERLFREIIALDPTNLYAHETIAELATLRGETMTIDSTALSANDSLTVSRSQAEWPSDPTRRQAAIDTYAIVIEERRVLASELQPDNPSAQVAVAEAYFKRQRLLYSALGSVISDSDSMSDSTKTMGEQILADATQIREWTDRALANPSASRLDQIRAWSVRAESLEREWGWHLFFAGDEVKAKDLEQEYRQAVKDGIAVGEAQPIESTDEIAPLRTIYFKALFISQAMDQDDDAAATYGRKIGDLTTREQSERTEGITHYSTFCTEEREQEAGDALLAKGDVEGARAHYEAALAANPAHLDSLLSFATLHYEQGDIQAAIASTSSATETAPNSAEAWADLALYQLVAADTVARDAAYDQFLTVAAQRPPHERMATIRDVVADLWVVLENHPDQVSQFGDVIPRLRDSLDRMATDSTGTYQYPALYAELGRLALYADQASLAEPLLRQSLALDPHLPVAHADLVMSVLVQGRDASKEIETAFNEAEDPTWLNIIDFDPDQVLTMMQQEASRYGNAFKDRKETIESFTSAIPEERKRQEEKRRGLEGNVYTSPTYGYTLNWDSGWSVGDASSDQLGQFDLLQVSNGVTTVLLRSSSSDAVDATECLDEFIGTIESAANWQDLTPALETNGSEPRSASPERAYAIYLDRPIDDPASASVYHLECHKLTPSGSFLVTFVLIPTSLYEQQMGPVDQLLGTLQLAGSPAEGVSTDAQPLSTPMSLPVLDMSALGPELPGVTGNVYISPSHEFSLAVDPPWEIRFSSTNEDTDSVELGNGNSSIYLDAYPGASGNTTACVGEVSKELAADDAFSDVAIMTDGDGKPLRGTDAIGVYVVFSYTRDEGNGDEAVEQALYVGCRALPMGAMLRVLHVMDPESYQAQSLARDELLKGLAIPAPEGTPPATPVSTG